MCDAGAVLATFRLEPAAGLTAAKNPHVAARMSYIRSCTCWRGQGHMCFRLQQACTKGTNVSISGQCCACP